MEELTFELEYDDDLDLAVEKISKCLNKIGYDIDYDEFAEENDAGLVGYRISQIV